MLHILLGILKGIGTVLLIILAVIVLLLLLVLFVPLRYQVRLRKTGKEEPFAADAGITWLLHLLRIRIHYQEGAGTIDLLLFGHRLKTFYVPKGSAPSESAGGGRRQRGKGHKKSVEKDHAEDAEKAGGTSPDSCAGDQNTGESDTAGGDPDGQKSGEQESGEQGSGGQGSGGQESGDQDAGEQGSEGPGSSGTGGDQSSAAEFLRKARLLLERVPEHLTGLTERLLDGLLKVCSLPADVYAGTDDWIERQYQKICDLQKKIGPFVSEEAFSLYGTVLRRLLYLIRCYKPCRAAGSMTLGTGKPDWTGKLIGFLYLVLPADAEKFEIIPDFYEPVFETDMTMTGRIRLNHAAYALVCLLLSRDVRAFLRRVRHRDGSGRKKENNRDGR